ncbi:MAG: helix-turn-helix transcriptional regulator [Tannerella sp.]|nr:helix-turn-helix transcriptional regulator [Tannerella sp.]
MKVEEVPQDSKFLKNTVIRDVAYAVDNEGNYTSVISEGWEVKNDALDVTWDAIGEKCAEIREKVLAGKLSPLAYHLEKNIMSVGLLAKYTGLTRRKVRKHLKPEKFKELDDSVLAKYAEALRVSIEELKTVQ